MLQGAPFPGRSKDVLKRSNLPHGSSHGTYIEVVVIVVLASNLWRSGSRVAND